MAHCPILPSAPCSPTGKVCTDGTQATTCDAGEAAAHAALFGQERTALPCTPCPALTTLLAAHRPPTTASRALQTTTSRTWGRRPAATARCAASRRTRATPPSRATTTALCPGWTPPAPTVRAALGPRFYVGGRNGWRRANISPLADLSLHPPLLCAASAAGQEYNPESESCVMCPAGTQRLVGREDACMPW